VCNILSYLNITNLPILGQALGAHNLPLHALSRQLLLHCGRGQHGRADRAHQEDRHCEGEQNFLFFYEQLFKFNASFCNYIPDLSVSYFLEKLKIEAINIFLFFHSNSIY